MTTNTSTRPNLFSIANQLTTLRLFLSFILFWLISAGWWRLALITFILAAITDGLDGYFARGRGEVTSFGRMYDPLIDKILIAGAFVFLMPIPVAAVSPWLVTIVIAREFLVTGIRGFLEEQGVSFGADQLGKIKMVLQCAAIIWILLMFDLHLEESEASWPLELRDGLNLIALVATVVSGLNYLRKAWPYLRPSAVPPGNSAG